jgi:hypothetical protein
MLYKTANQIYMSTSKGKYDYFTKKKAPEACGKLINRL